MYVFPFYGYSEIVQSQKSVYRAWIISEADEGLRMLIRLQKKKESDRIEKDS